MRPAASANSSRVVVRRSAAARLEQLAALDRRQVLAYSPFSALLLWLRLWFFLVRSQEPEIVCFRSPGRFRFLKLLAWSLPGKLVFSDGKGARLSCSRFHFLRAALAAKGAICVAGSASPERLRAIVSSVRDRYPDARLHGVGCSSPELFDTCEPAPPSLSAYFRLLRRSAGRQRFRAVVLPCTGEKYSALKALAWALPVRRVEIYNENLDVFSGRNPLALVRHWLWRRRQTRDRRRRALPIGVIGSASAFFLETIVEDARARCPGAAVHGLLQESLAEAASGLFDRTTILGRGGFWQLLRAARGRYQCWIVPCTDEPYARMKLLAFALPFRHRRIYNEQADAFAVRDLRTLRGHIFWRLRDHLSFQIFAGTAGPPLPVRLLHLAWFVLRLAAGAELLVRVRIRAYVRSRLPQAVRIGDSRSPRPAVDMICLDTPGQAALPLPLPAMTGRRVGVAARIPNEGRPRDLVGKINAAIESSKADFVCLFDSRCRMTDPDWLDRLLETFDDRTGQVGPQVVSSLDGSVIRGGLVGGGGRPRWNSDHAVCWRARPDWLAIEALPWICIVFRRAALLEAGLFRENSEEEAIPVDIDFCRRLAAHGLQSICNESVTATFPTIAEVAEAAPAIGSFPGASEDRS